MKHLKILFLNFLVFIIIFEICCRTIPFLVNYCWVADFKSTNEFYESVRKRVEVGKYAQYTTKEFSSPYTINKLGLFDNEVINPTIIGLGDSFTQCVGTSPDSTWLKLLETKLNLSTLNAGIGASNPLQQLVTLKKLYANDFRPKLLIHCINTTDIYDIAMNEQGFYNEYLKSSIFIYRLIKLEDWKRIFYKKELIYTKTHDIIYKSIVEANEICKKNNCAYIVVFNPLKEELSIPWCWDTLANKLEQNDIKTIDLKKSYIVDGRINKNTIDKYFWKIDGHHNTKGYQVMGEIILKEVDQLKLNIAF